MPIANTPYILSSQISGRYRVVDQPGLGLIGFLGVAYEQIDYEDTQKVPNDIEVDLGPMVILGLEFIF